MLRLPIDASGLRVFRGYRRPGLPEADFLDELGAVFMPGTPLMLRDLGLAAYLPVVVPHGSEPDLPDEVAIIAYASAETYARARNESLIGRLYTHTHRGVFDMDRSRSAPPISLGTYTAPVTAFSLWNDVVDWQADGDIVVLVGERQSTSDTSFGVEVCRALSAGAASLRASGCREVVGQVADSWMACWFLLDEFDADVDTKVRSMIEGLALPSRQLLLTSATRLVWYESTPPAATSVRGTAWSYIFEREGHHFLR